MECRCRTAIPEAVPWFFSSAKSSASTGDTIRATAFNLKAGIKHTDNATLSYDDGREHIDGAVRCVIVATTMDKANHYILLISSAVHTTDATHERVGVGYSSEEFIDRASGVEVVIG